MLLHFTHCLDISNATYHHQLLTQVAFENVVESHTHRKFEIIALYEFKKATLRNLG